jgi:hypothetical protein
MSIQQRSIGVLLALSLACIGAAVVTIRAAEQKAGAAGAQPTSTSAQGAAGAQASPTAKGPQDAGPKSNSAGQQPASGAPATGGHQSASAPQVPEESATIHDDPTVAPDPQESADNNVSFPADI